MARFDVFRVVGRSAILVIDVQANLLDLLNTRVVVPLAPLAVARAESMARLNPVIRLFETDYVLMPTDIAVLPSKLLIDPICNVEQQYRLQITAALDFLFQGY